MTPALRLTAVLTHPVQYYAPWFRWITTYRPELKLTVVYATQPTPQQQGVGFGEAFAWDLPLTDGYANRVVEPPSEKHRFDHYRGLDIPALAEAVVKTAPQVVLLPGWNSICYRYVVDACRQRRIPMLYRGDTHLGNRPTGFMGRLWDLRTRRRLHPFAGYLAVGKRAHAYLRYHRVPESRIFPAPHCVDNRFFADRADAVRSGLERQAGRGRWGIGPEDFAVLFAGKLEPMKRPLDAVAAVARLGPQAVLLVAGAGPLAAAMKSEAARRQLRVHWCGFANQTEMPDILARADCLILPSQARYKRLSGETWGLVVNEALAAGTPCVVSQDVGCAPDLIEPGLTGEVFPTGDEAAAAAALERIRTRLAAGHHFRETCRRKIDAYSFAAATAGLMQACWAVAGRPGRPATPKPTPAAEAAEKKGE